MQCCCSCMRLCLLTEGFLVYIEPIEQHVRAYSRRREAAEAAETASRLETECRQRKVSEVASSACIAAFHEHAAVNFSKTRERRSAARVETIDVLRDNIIHQRQLEALWHISCC